MDRDHGLATSRATHDHVRPALAEPLAAQPLDPTQDLASGHSSISLDTLPRPASITSLSAWAMTASRSRVACW